MALSRVRLARLDAGFTMFDMFRKTRIQPSRQSLIERGLIEARPDEAARIAKALNADAAVLFPQAAAVGADAGHAGDAV